MEYNFNWGNLYEFYPKNSKNHDFDRLQEVIKKDLYTGVLSIIGRVYRERYDKSGNPESWHLIYTSEYLQTEAEKITALLHDIVEDDYLTFDALILLRHDKSVFPEYEDYITNILESNNLLAIRVKYADMRNNLSQERVGKLEEQIRVRLKQKWCPQIIRIENKLNELENNDLQRKRRYIC